MTVESSVSKSVHYGNDVATVFPVGFEYVDTSLVEVVLTVPDGAGSSNTTLTIDVDYTLSGGGAAGDGEVNYPISGDPLADGEKLTVYSAVPITQAKAWNNLEAIDTAEFEKAADKLTRIARQLQEQIDRCVQVPITEDTDPSELVQSVRDSEAAAAVSAAAAATATGVAAAASALAQKWAEEAEDTEVESGAYSALHHATKAAAAQVAAEAARDSVGAASTISYDGTESGLTATDVQAALTELAEEKQGALGSGTDGQVLRLSGGVPVWSSSRKILHAREVQSVGVGGGTSVSGWQMRALNTIISNTIPGASLVSNQLLLPAGTYDLFAWANAVMCNNTKLALYNMSLGSYILYGQNAWADCPTTAYTTSATQPRLCARFTLLSSQYVSLNHYIQTARATTGLGIPTGIVEEVYSEVFVCQV